MLKDAFISSCGKYRYGLVREWDHNKKAVAFMLLNPSTADGKEDDPTVRRCIDYAKTWGYGGLYIVNVCPYRSTDPKLLPKVDIPDIIYENNSVHIASLFKVIDKFIAGWGNSLPKKFINRSEVIIEILTKGKKLYTLATNKDGSPRHPLYLKKDLLPKLMGEESDG